MLIVMAVGLAGSLLLVFGGAVKLYHARAAADAASMDEGMGSNAAVAETGDIVRARELSPTRWVHALLSALPGIERLDRLRRRASVSAPLALLVGACLTPACGGIVLAFAGFIDALTLAAIAVVGSAALPAYLSRRAAARREHFQRQLPDALEQIARALRAGHAFLAGMKMVAEEYPSPIGSEFGTVVKEITFGVSVSEALTRLTERVDSTALKFFVTSVMIQRDTGGNLAEIVDTISLMTRKRFELAAKVRAVSAEGRLSAVILFALPFALGALLLLINPEHVLLLFRDPIGRQMTVGAGALMVIGAVIIKRMVTIRT